MTEPVEVVLARLQRVKRARGGHISSSCPTARHPRGDRSRGLSISVGDDGRVLLHCFAGCSSEEIVASIGLALRDLFDPATSKPRPPPRRREPKDRKPAHALRRLAHKLAERVVFPVEWELSCLLAEFEERDGHVEIVRNWDRLVARGVDLPLVVATADAIREVAVPRYPEARCDDAVHLLLAEVRDRG